MGVLIRGYLVSRKFSVPLAAKLCVGPTKVLELWPCGNVLDMLYHTFTDAKFGGYRNSPAAGAAKNGEFFVCLFVTLLNVRVCAPDFDMKA